MTITIGENPKDSKAPAGTTKSYFGQKAPFDLGFKIADWSDSLAQEFEIDGNAPHNPIISEITAGSAAEASGFQAGDIIIDVNRQPTAKATDVIRNLKQGRNIIRLIRGNAMLIVSIGSAQ